MILRINSSEHVRLEPAVVLLLRVSLIKKCAGTEISQPTSVNINLQTVFIRYLAVLFQFAFSQKLLCKGIFLSLYAVVKFLGCSEAKHKHDYGCDEDDQSIKALDKNNQNVQVK